MSKSKKGKANRRRSRPNIARQTLQSTQSANKDENLAETYAYVISDLRRIALVAAAMLAILITLSFVLD